MPCTVPDVWEGETRVWLTRSSLQRECGQSAVWDTGPWRGHQPLGRHLLTPGHNIAEVIFVIVVMDLIFIECNLHQQQTVTAVTLDNVIVLFSSSHLILSLIKPVKDFPLHIVM